VSDAVAVADVNGDGKLDLILGPPRSSSHSDPSTVLLNSGTSDGPAALQLRAHATSLSLDDVVDTPVAEIGLKAEMSSVGAEFHNYVDFWVSADGGRHWAAITSNGQPIVLAHPGGDVRWRALLRSESPFHAGALAIEALTLSLTSFGGTAPLKSSSVIGSMRDVSRSTAVAWLGGANKPLSTVNEYAPPPGHTSCDPASAGTAGNPAAVTTASQSVIKEARTAAVDGGSRVLEHAEPVQIHLVGPACLVVDLNVVFVDPGAVASKPGYTADQLDVSVSSPVNVNVVGTYIVTYQVQDEEGFVATTQRTVFVRADPAAAPPQAPVDDGGGGGAIGSFELLGLLLLAVTRAAFFLLSALTAPLARLRPDIVATPEEYRRECGDKPLWWDAKCVLPPVSSVHQLPWKRAACFHRWSANENGWPR
jgi:hypothetical protein